MSAVRLAEVVKRFGDVVAVAGVDLEVESGEFLMVLGPSGCGKTTLIRTVAGLETPTPRWWRSRCCWRCRPPTRWHRQVAEREDEREQPASDPGPAAEQRHHGAGGGQHLPVGDVFYWQPLIASALIIAIPVGLVYNLFLNRLIQGFTAGAVKG